MKMVVALTDPPPNPQDGAAISATGGVWAEMQNCDFHALKMTSSCSDGGQCL